MAVKYQTGISTLTQFVAMIILNFVSGIVTSIKDCAHDTGAISCVSDVMTSLLLFLVTAGWFAFIWVLGYAAQDRRSKRIAQGLIAAETLVVLAALLDARHFPDILGLFTSVVDAGLAIWTIVLAWRIIRANGGRVMAANVRPRRRHPTKAE